MAAIQKGTKLTDNPKDYMLRVRLDGNTLKKLDVICETKMTTRSRLVRDLIEEKYHNIKK